MTRAKYYYFGFSNGHHNHFTIDEAIKYAEDNQVEVTRDPLKILKDHGIRREKNGFQAGYHPYFKQHVRGMNHFKQLCKEYKVDIAEKPMKESDFTRPMPKMDFEQAKEIKNMAGCEVTDSALDALVMGERLSDIPIDNGPNGGIDDVV
jgi:hypothetical protein